MDVRIPIEVSYPHHKNLLSSDGKSVVALLMGKG